MSKRWAGERAADFKREFYTLLTTTYTEQSLALTFFNERRKTVKNGTLNGQFSRRRWGYKTCEKRKA